ncbi:MAG: c-type cytochrome [Novosphingobium sp.]
MRGSGSAMAIAALALMLAACGGKQDDAEPEAAPASDAASPPAVADSAPTSAVQCKVCHSFVPGTNGVGPSLAGVVGRKAGTAAGFAYSPAMKGSGLTWDEATLDAYLTAPMKTVPGTKMVYAGLADAAKRKELIDWLATVK